MEEVGCGVPVDRENGKFVEEVGLGFAQLGVTGPSVTEAGGFFVELVVTWAAPISLVVGVSRAPHAQESRRIDVVADPASACDVVADVIDGLLKYFPFLVGDGDAADAEVLLPHVLNGLGNRFVLLGGVDHDLEGRDVGTRDVAREGEVFPGFSDIEANEFRRFVTGVGGRGESRGGLLAAHRDVFDDGFAVDGVGESFAEVLVVQGSFRDVAAEEVGAGVDVDVGDVGVFFLVVVDEAGGNDVGLVEEAVSEGAFFGEVVVEGVEGDAVELDLVGVPVVRVAGDSDGGVDAPGVEFEGTVADVVAGALPFTELLGPAAEFFDGGAVDGIPGGVLDDVWKEGGRVFEGADERVVVGRFDAHLFEVGDFALVELFSILEEVEHGGVGTRHFRIENAVVGVDEVVGGDGVAVGPFGGLAEMEGPFGEVVVGIPALGDARVVDGVVGGVVGDEAFVEGAQNVAVADGLDDVRVEGFRFAAVAEEEDFVASRPSGAVLALAGGEEGRGQGDDCDEAVWNHGRGLVEWGDFFNENPGFVAGKRLKGGHFESIVPSESVPGFFMRDYFIQRLLLTVPTLLGITLIIFFITRFVPGGPMEQAIAQARAAALDGGGGGGASQEMALSEDQLDQLREYYGFDKPWYVAYTVWLGNVFTGDFGRSYIYHEPVVDVIKQRLPVSAFYGVVTLILTYLVCIPLGIFKAVKHNSAMDNVTSVLVFVGYAVPGYVLGAILVVFLSAKLEWFPIGGFVSYGFEDLSFNGKILDLLHHSALPLVCYLIGSFAFVTFLMKNHLMENLATDYIRTAVAKGISFKDAIVKHALRNSMIPIATNFGHQVSVLIMGSFLIETIFDIDGFGLLGFKSVIDRDYPVVMGVVLLGAVLMLLGDILSDILVALVDPRVRFK